MQTLEILICFSEDGCEFYRSAKFLTPIHLKLFHIFKNNSALSTSGNSYGVNQNFLLTNAFAFLSIEGTSLKYINDNTLLSKFMLK